MEEMDKTLLDMEEEVKEGVCAVKEWLHNTLYEANRVLQEHKKAIAVIAAAVAGVFVVAAALFAIFRKK